MARLIKERHGQALNHGVSRGEKWCRKRPIIPINGSDCGRQLRNDVAFIKVVRSIHL